MRLRPQLPLGKHRVEEIIPGWIERRTAGQPDGIPSVEATAGR